MDQFPFWVFSIFFLLLSVAKSETEEVKLALVQFMAKLSPGNIQTDPNWGWNSTSDPCAANWKGVTCNSQKQSVKKIVLNQLNFTGILDSNSLCKAETLFVLSLNGNNVGGDLPENISNCKFLTHLYLSGNSLSGNLPSSLSQLNNLKRIDFSNNELSGELPDTSRISGLLTFFAQNNKLNGEISKFDFSNLVEFNVSNNNLSGPIPDTNGHFNASSFSGNPNLCGKPLSISCPLSPPPHKKKSRRDRLIYSGYIILGLFVVLLFVIIVIKKRMGKNKKTVKKDVQLESGSGDSSEFKNGRTGSEFSITSVESGMGTSSSLVVLASPMVNVLKFEDLLRAPAELVGRGKYGSLYKVLPVGGMALAVKRIKGWEISRDDFKIRMERMHLAKHPNVLPVIAYYCSKQEKLLVYEYQRNGSLFSHLHGSKNGQLFNWGSRLSIAASTAKALTFMHEVLGNDGIAHGNLKSSNVLLNNDMDPYISEYGLMTIANNDQSFSSRPKSFKIKDSAVGRPYSAFKVDIYNFGVILLELLTGKLVQNNGFDLAKWVHSVVREEWTAEVFDKALISEGASEERMVNLLQVALKCINHIPDDRPSFSEVAKMINSIKEDEDRSISSEEV